MKTTELHKTRADTKTGSYGAEYEVWLVVPDGNGRATTRKIGVVEKQFFAAGPSLYDWVITEGHHTVIHTHYARLKHAAYALECAVSEWA